MAYRAEIKIGGQTFTIDDNYGPDGYVAALYESDEGACITHEMLVRMYEAIGQYLKSKEPQSGDRVEIVGDFIMRP